MLRRSLTGRHRTGKARAFVYHDPSLRILRSGSGFQQLKRMGMPTQRTGGFHKVDSFFANNQYQHAWPLLTHDDLGNSDQSNNTNNILYSMYMPKRNKGTAPWFRGADTYSVKYCEQGRYEYQRYLMINRFPSEYRKHFMRFLHNIRGGAAATALPQEALHWLLRMIVDNFHPQHVHYIAAMTTLQSCGELDMARDVWKVMERQCTWPDTLTLCAYLDVCVAAAARADAMEAWNRYGSELRFLRKGEVDPKPVTRVPFALSREELLYLPKWKKHFDHDPNLDVPDRNRFNRTREVYLRMAQVMLAAGDAALFAHFYQTLIAAMRTTPTPVPEPPNPHVVRRPRWTPYLASPSLHRSPWRLTPNGQAMALGPAQVVDDDAAALGGSRFLTNEQFIVHTVSELLAVLRERWLSKEGVVRGSGELAGGPNSSPLSLRRRSVRWWECLGEQEAWMAERGGGEGGSTRCYGWIRSQPSAWTSSDSTETRMKRGVDGVHDEDGACALHTEDTSDRSSRHEDDCSSSSRSSSSDYKKQEEGAHEHVPREEECDVSSHVEEELNSNTDEWKKEAAALLAQGTRLVDDVFTQLAARGTLAEMNLGTLIARVLALHREVGQEGGAALHARAHALCRRAVGITNERAHGTTKKKNNNNSDDDDDDENNNNNEKENTQVEANQSPQVAAPALTAACYCEILRGFADESAFLFDHAHNRCHYRPGFDPKATMRGLTQVLCEMSHHVHVPWSADMHLEVVRTLVGCGTMAANDYFVQHVLRQYPWTCDFLEALYLEYRRQPEVDLWSELTKRALVWTARYNVKVSERLRRLIEDDYTVIGVHTRSFRELAVFQFRDVEEKRYARQVVNELPNPWMDYVSHALPFPDRDAGYPDEYGDIGQWRAPGGPGSPVRGPGYYAPPMEGEHLRGYTAEWRDLKNPMKPPSFPVPWERKYRQYARGQHPSYDMTYAGPMPEIFPGRHNFRKPTRWDYHDIEKQGKFKISGPY